MHPSSPETIHVYPLYHSVSIGDSLFHPEEYCSLSEKDTASHPSLECISFSSVAQLCPVLDNPMDCSTPGLPVHHLAQTHVHQVSDAIQPSHPLSSPSPPAFSLSQHQGLFQWVSSSHQVAKVLELQLQHQSFQWTLRTDFLWDWFDLLVVQGTFKCLLHRHSQKYQWYARAALKILQGQGWGAGTPGKACAKALKSTLFICFCIMILWYNLVEGGIVLTYVYLWLIHVDVWQKTTQYRKTIIL